MWTNFYFYFLLCMLTLQFLCTAANSFGLIDVNTSSAFAKDNTHFPFSETEVTQQQNTQTEKKEIVNYTQYTV